ncbi:hypothetical protein D3C85_724980 [compost metagenome]
MTDVGDGQGVDAGEGFVQQHEAGAGGQGAGDLDAATLAARQAGGRGQAQMVDAQLFQQAGRLVADAGGGLLMQFDHGLDVLLDRHAAEDGGFLRQIAQAHAGALVHGLLGDLFAVQPDRAAVGRDQAGDHVEAGGLARPVGTEQAADLAALDGQGHVLDHLTLAEAAGDVLDAQAGVARLFSGGRVVGVRLVEVQG